MTRVIAAGLHGFVTQPDGTNVQTAIYLAVDPDTHEVTGYLDPADAKQSAPAADAAPEGGES